MSENRQPIAYLLVAGLLATPGCRPSNGPAVSDTPEAGAIAVCGQYVPTSARVLRWDDSGGFNAYAEHRFFNPAAVEPFNPAPGCNTPKRYAARACLIVGPGDKPPDPSRERELIRKNVDQIVIHYDAAGSSRRCFEVLHDERGLSAHFLIDTDGTIYQTLDVRERARHAGLANDRSVGIELANLGAYKSLDQLDSLRRKLSKKSASSPSSSSSRMPDRAVVGYVHDRRLHQYSYTDEQYHALIQLVRALRVALPNITTAVPLDRDGLILTRTLTRAELASFRGTLGHLHVSAEKIDPGPAFDWKRLHRGISSSVSQSHPSE